MFFIVAVSHTIAVTRAYPNCPPPWLKEKALHLRILDYMFHHIGDDIILCLELIRRIKYIHCCHHMHADIKSDFCDQRACVKHFKIIPFLKNTESLFSVCYSPVCICHSSPFGNEMKLPPLEGHTRRNWKRALWW